MPQVTGMELLRTLRSVPPVIITTAYREFAVEGYEFNVIDYLVKPISFERFLKAVDKYEFVHGVMGGASAGTTGKVGVGAVGGDDAESSGGNDVPGSGLRDVVGSGSGGAGRSGRSDAEAFIYVKSDKKMVRILLRDILYIEGLKDYVRIHAVDRAIVTYETLGHLEQKLSANDFIRVHRSYIISLQHIAAYSASQVEIGKESIPIGSSY
jgi:DNA-binding LytR/AlgR family response regulator